MTSPLIGAALAAMLASATAAAPAAPEVSKVREAWERGRNYFIEHNGRPSLKQVSSGGYVKVRTRSGQERTLGPDVYIEYQLYDVTLLLSHSDELGLTAEDPLVRQAFDWLLSAFDSKTGSWPLWSAEGCLHTKETLILQRFGKTEEARKAMAWNLSSPLYARPAFLEAESGFLIQSWGSPSGSLTGENRYMLGRITAEMTLLNLFTLAELGYTTKDAVVVRNIGWIDEWLRERTWHKDEFDGFMGLAKLPELVERYGLDRNLLKTPVAVLAPKLSRSEKDKSKLERDVYFVAEVLRGLVRARRLGAQVPEGAIEGGIAQLLAMQAEDGHWTMTLVERGREPGLFISDLNGTATLSATLALRAWLDEAEARAKEAPAPAAPDVQAPAPAETRPVPAPASATPAHR